MLLLLQGGRERMKVREEVKLGRIGRWVERR